MTTGRPNGPSTMRAAYRGWSCNDRTSSASSAACCFNSSVYAGSFSRLRRARRRSVHRAVQVRAAARANRCARARPRSGPARDGRRSAPRGCARDSRAVCEHRAHDHTVECPRRCGVRALKRCPRTDGRQLGLPRALAGDLRGAAAILARAPGLGWSSANHPGHVLFALFAIVLADGAKQKVHATLLANLESTCRDPLDMFSRDEIEAKSAAMPSVSKLIEDVRPLLTIDTADRHALVDAMRGGGETDPGEPQGVETPVLWARGHARRLLPGRRPKGPAERIADWIAQLQATYPRRSRVQGRAPSSYEPALT